MKCKQSGQTLLEVLMVAGVMSLLLVVLVSMTTKSIARNRGAEKRVVATRLAQQGVEWLRSERDRIGWLQFRRYSDQLTNNGLKDMCLISFDKKIDSSPPSTTTSNCSNTLIEGEYYIQLNMLWDIDQPGPDDDHYKVTVYANWLGNDVGREPVTLVGDLYEK